MTLRVINFADGFTSDNVPVADAIQAHIDNPTDAHDASAISFDNVDSELVAINVQDAIDEVEARLDTAETDITDHVDNETDAHNASAISYVNTTSGLVATQVQAAIDEVEARLGTAETDIQTIEDSVGQANGIAPLNGSSKIDATYLPSYVDDVLEYADLISFPLVGETSKIYVTLDTNKTYRWTGSVYIEISASEVTSVNSQSGAVVLDADDIAETASRYWSKKNNVTTTAPTVSNDLSQNYSVGSQWYDSAADTLYICESATIGAAVWQPISGAGGGVGSVDIMFADTFENTDIADYTITQPLASISAASPLQGENSLLIAHDFNPDYYIERIIPIDNKFKNKNVTFTLDVFTNAASGNLTLSVWDHTNTVQLLNSELIQPQDADQTSVKRSFSFNIPSGANELRYRINVLFDSGKVSRVDNLVIELTQMSKLDTTIEVPAITEIQSIVPVIGLTGGTLSNQDGKIRQVGEKLEMTANFKWSSIFTGGAATITLPNNLAIDTSKIAGGVPTNVDTVLGKAVLYDSSASASYFGSVVYNSSTSVIIKHDFNTNGNAYPSTFNSTNISTTLPFTWAASDEITVDFSVPILGWEATETQSVSLAQTVLVQESDSAFTGLGFVGNGSTNTGVIRLSGSVSNYGDALTYVSDAILGDSWTVNKAGIYDVHASVDTTGGGGYPYYFTRNATVLTATAASTHPISSRLSNTGYANINNDVTQISGSDYLDAGDVIRFHCATAGVTASNNQYDVIKITYQGSLKQLNVSENQKIEIPTSELRMEGASTRGSTATAIVRFDNIAKIRGDAFEVLSDATLGTRIVMKKKGKLDISTTLQTSTYISVQITKNQQGSLTGLSATASEIIATSLNDASGPAANNATHQLSNSIFVEIGDVFRVAQNVVAGTPYASVNNSLTLSFQEQEVSVSVTNVLPQFSESDSSVRVDTANGYGSPTGTKIRRFSNTRDNLGSAIEYVPSATNGDSFLIKEDGIYHISYTDGDFNAIEVIGITKNASSLTTNVDSLAASEILAIDSNAAGFEANAMWSGYLQSGDVIRAQSRGGGSSTNGLTRFTISKVGKPNVTGVDVTPFAKIEYEVTQFASMNYLTVLTSGTSNNIRYVVNNNTNTGLISITDNGTNTVFTALKPCKVDFATTLVLGASGNLLRISKNGSFVEGAAQNNATMDYGQTTYIDNLNAGDFFIIQTSSALRLNTGHFRLRATELRDAYQVIGGGVENTYSSKITSAGSIANQSYPFIQSVTKGGAGIYNVTFVAGFFTATPSAIANFSQDAAGVISGAGAVQITDTSSSSLVVRTFNTSFVAADMPFNLQVIRQGNDYRTPSKAIGLPAQRIAYIKDVKAANASSGTFTSGAWQTRTLNTLTDSTGLVTSLASNQFVLPAGVYDIEATAPAYKVSRHKAKIRNTTDGLDVLSGEGSYTDSTDNTQTTAIVSGRISITSSKTFELQHRCQTSTATNGFGVESNFVIDEVYAQVKITKIEE